MGASCTKFGSYLLRKEESKAVSNGGTPKLNKLEHKQSFVASPTTVTAEETTNGVLPTSPPENLVENGQL